MKRYLLVLTLLALLFVSCSSSTVDRHTTPTPTPTLAPTPTKISLPSTEVSFKTTDGETLKGLIYGHSKKAAVFSHMYRDNKTDWQDFAEVIAAKDYMTLVYDFRGHGDSSGTFEAAKMPVDLAAAINFTVKQGAEKIVLLGASMGGMATIEEAARDHKHISGIVTVSSPLDWGNLTITDKDLKALSMPKLFVNSDQDDFAEDTKHMYAVSAEPKQLHLYQGRAHGVELFTTPDEPDFSKRLTDFIAQSLQ